MGIPAFTRNIVSKFGTVIVQTVPDAIQKCRQTDRSIRLFIDGNCIIHKCAHEVITKHVDVQLDDIEKMVIQNSIEYIKYICSIVNPQMTYIAIDGVCPRAKMTQQRKRRYISTWRTSMVANDPDYMSKVNIRWNSNCITPGTLFMDKFDKSLLASFSSNTDVIVSSSTEIGEGEHKIYNYIRATNDENVPMTNVVYGLDADLIMLSLLSICISSDCFIKDSTILLLREKPEFKLDNMIDKTIIPQLKDDEFLVFDINALKTAIYCYYFDVNVCLDSTTLDAVDVDMFIKDYVCLCTFVGNDFLPPLSYMKVKNDSISEVIKVYLSLRKQFGYSLVTASGNINMDFLNALLKDLSHDEDTNMTIEYDKYYERKTPTSQLRSYHRTLWELDNFPSFNKNQLDKMLINPREKGWRVQYYHYLFTKSACVIDICQNYLEGLQWVMDYYVKQDPLFDWHYRYAYSPTLLDLSNHITYNCLTKTQPHHMLPAARNKDDNGLLSNICNRVDNGTYIKIMASGLLQLLMVLPPSSSDLIPNAKVAQLMSKVEHGCVHYFPQKYKISTFLKQYLWECSPFLPDINMLHLYNASQKAL